MRRIFTSIVMPSYFIHIRFYIKLHNYNQKSVQISAWAVFRTKMTKCLSTENRLLLYWQGNGKHHSMYFFTWLVMLSKFFRFHLKISYKSYVRKLLQPTDIWEQPLKKCNWSFSIKRKWGESGIRVSAERGVWFVLRTLLRPFIHST